MASSAAGADPDWMTAPGSDAQGQRCGLPALHNLKVGIGQEICYTCVTCFIGKVRFFGLFCTLSSDRTPAFPMCHCTSPLPAHTRAWIETIDPHVKTEITPTHRGRWSLWPQVCSVARF